MTDKAKTGLDLLREPFPANQISKLPKPTKAQTDAVKANFREGIRCQLCGAWHHPDVVHLDYVGHAALTDRLLDADPSWSWEPVAFRDGLPAFDHTGGLWIKLTVCGVTRLGYGHAAGKPQQDPGAREKEVIGDALRNAAMRFGAALDLWHKGVLHEDADDATDHSGSADASEPAARSKDKWREEYSAAESAIRSAPDKATLKSVWEGIAWDKAPRDWIAPLPAEKNARLKELSQPKASSDPFAPIDPTSQFDRMEQERVS